MKSFILLPTGIADRPVDDLDGRTALEAARTPGLDRLAREGRVGLVRQVPPGLRIASDTAALSVLGYDPRRHDVTRGALEAAGMGVELADDDLALRCNLVSTYRGQLVDFNAGQIGSVEARLLIEALQEALGGPRVSFHAGLGYRNLLVLRGGRELRFETVPPQEVQGQPLDEYLPYGRDASMLRQVMAAAGEVLATHDVNRVRVDMGENPADRIWPWGPGWRTLLEPFELRTRRSLAVLAAVPLMRGLGSMVGASVPEIPGATGHYDTDYAGKLRAALAALDEHDVVLLHVAAANEACHETDARRKVTVIEELDRYVVWPLLSALERRGDARLLVTTDHMTSTVAREGSTTHVPFALWGPGFAPVRARRFTEAEAEAGELRVDEGHRLLELLLREGPAGAPGTAADAAADAHAAGAPDPAAADAAADAHAAGAPDPAAADAATGPVTRRPSTPPGAGTYPASFRTSEDDR